MNEPGEQWRPVVGYDGYEVSDLGRVRSWRIGGSTGGGRRAHPLIRKLIANERTGGYLYVMLSVGGKVTLRQVHVMVLEAFRGLRSDGQETRHLDDTVTNNRLKNLVWGTRQEQFDDQVRRGTDTRGERNGAAKLSSVQVKEIRRLLAAGASGVSLTKRFGVSSATITRIKKGARYAVVE